MKMVEINNHCYAVILAGGGGTRLWPKSRKSHPKHLLKLLSEETLLRLTFSRLIGVIPLERIIVVTLSDHADLVREELPELPEQNIVVEPEGKNTAYAMGMGAAFVDKLDKEAVIMNFLADHVITDQEKFLKTVSDTFYLAGNSDSIVTIGIKPTFPHTGLGYINFSDKLEGDVEGYKVVAFKEKPDLETAQKFLDSGKYLWNSGLYCWKASTLFEALEKYAPEVNESVLQIRQAIGQPNQEEVIKNVYKEAKSVQIDTAVSEKATNILVVKGDFPWSDIGGWSEVYDILDQKDENGNLVLGKSNYTCIDSKDCLIDAHGKLVVTIGVENVVIIDTKDAILICDKSRTQEVKKIVERLKEQEKHEYL